ncbi:MAG: helix-turn-helix transcriptional regulator [Treponema sp.]|nr:helix-turn-helix transcriptional regulator [Treponema sp.]
MDNRQVLLAENENKRLNFRLPILICFAMFAAWQMGMVHFSAETLSIDGRTPLPVYIDDFTLTVIISAGFILSILVMIFIPKTIVRIERITASAALFSALVLYLPLSADLLSIALYLQFFCCCFMVGFETAIIIGLFSERTAILHLSVAYGITQISVAFLHNDFFKIEYPVFRLFSVIALVMMLFFFFRLPDSVWPRTVTKTDGLPVPKGLFAGVLLWTCMTCCLILFANAVAEGVPHGVFVLYITTAICLILFYPLWKIFGSTPFRMLTVFISMGAMGFVLAIASFYVPSLSLVAIVFLGAGSVSCIMNPFVGLLLAKWYPSRFIAPAIIGVDLSMILVHSILLDILRSNTIMLHIVYLVIAVALVILYLMLEPYLSFSFRNKASVYRPVGEPAGESAGEIAIPVSPEPDKNWRDILQTNAFETLLEGELDIAGLIMLGYKNDDIARETRYTLNTVKSYRKNLYSKLQIHETRELFVVARKVVKDI